MAYEQMLIQDLEAQIAALRRELAEERAKHALTMQALDEAWDAGEKLRLALHDAQWDAAKKDAALRCARIKLARYWEQHGSSAIGGVAAEYDAVVKLIDAALAPAAQGETTLRKKGDPYCPVCRQWGEVCRCAPAPSAGETVLVPREPTREMCFAARRAQAEWLNREEADSPVILYRAMLAAAPTTGEPT